MYAPEATVSVRLSVALECTELQDQDGKGRFRVTLVAIIHPRQLAQLAALVDDNGILEIAAASSELAEDLLSP